MLKMRFKRSLAKLINQGGCCCAFLIETSKKKFFLQLEIAEIDKASQFWDGENDSGNKNLF